MKFKNNNYNKMEEKSFSFESENEFEKEINIKEFKKELRENIVKCLDDERKKSKKLDKRLFELEIVMFEVVVRDIKSRPGRPSKSLSKLQDLIRLYSTLIDIDKKMNDVKIGYKKYFEEELEREFVLS